MQADEVLEQPPALLLLAVPILVAGSLLLAAVLHDRAPGWRIYRTVLFVPYVLAVPIVATVFSNLLQLNGALNTGLRSAGLDAVALDWIGSPAIVLWTLMGIIVWREIGFGIILFSARMAALSEEVEEAARIDGAGWWSAAFEAAGFVDAFRVELLPEDPLARSDRAVARQALRRQCMRRARAFGWASRQSASAVR